MRMALLLLGLLVPSLAHALPPPTAPPNTTVYTQTVTRTQDGTPVTLTETTTISVGDKRTRWDRKASGQSTIFDHAFGAIFSWGGQIPPRTALKNPMPPALASWDLGYGTIAADSPPPTEKGTATIAGTKCTRLAFTSKHFGSPELCVTDKGIVAKFTLDDTATTTVTTFEAEKITPGTLPKSTFEVPPDRLVEDVAPL
ncbi:MAG TPA: hypothetical protein VGR62_04900 [Candidatus Binatia bacterium]|jgi:hypothetical protein|nr:hypothetical protein [Candidatus Binatia bacterium]